jgi:hypothetical protein
LGTNNGAGPAVEGDNNVGGIGVSGTSFTGIGVSGLGASVGVFGGSAGANSVGVGGSSGGTNSVGVSGNSRGIASRGVYGTSDMGIGVHGVTEGTSPAVLGENAGGSVGVYGLTTTPAGGQPAVLGVNGGGGPGVVGFSSAGTGVGGGTDTGIGFGGIASGSGNGVQGQTTSGIAVEGIATGASGFSGYFTGGLGVAVNGNFTVNHGFAKSAAVRGKDGTLVRLYSLESPESWFEDFGTAQLSNGSVVVPLEPGFAGVVKTDTYHVFLTPRGDCKGLYVSSQTPTSFTVHELQGGSSGTAFAYRVVAKRKDIEGARLEHVDEPPAVQLIQLPDLPTSPPGHGR